MHIVFAPKNITIFRKYSCVLFFLLDFSFTFFTHSFVHSFGFIMFFHFRERRSPFVHFDRDESLTEVHRQVVGVVVNNGDNVSFYVYNTYGLRIHKLYNIYELIIHKFYITYGFTIHK